MDPLDAETVKAIIEGREIWVDDEVSLFVKSVLYSAYASSIALVQGSLEPMLDGSFLKPAYASYRGGRASAMPVPCWSRSSGTCTLGRG